MSIIENGLNIIKSNLEINGLSRDLDILGLYCHFCLNCQQEAKTFIFNGQTLTLDKGCVLYSQLKYSEIFRLSIGKINKMVKLMEKIGIGENKNTNKYSIFKLNEDFILSTVGKQNEMKVKAKGNIYKDLKYNNKIINIYISEIEKYFYDKTGKDHKIKNIDSDITLDQFKKSLDNYLAIFESKLTFYNWEFGLNDFLSSPKGFRRFLDAKLEDYLRGDKIEDFEFIKTQEKRKKIIETEKQKEFDELEKKKLIDTWFSDLLSSMDPNELQGIKDRIKADNKDILDKAGKFESVMASSLLRGYLTKHFNCPY